MRRRTHICRKSSSFGMQRYFRTFASNPSDSISDVVIQMHFLSLYKGRICVYSTRTCFIQNSYTNSYTRFSALGKIYKFSKSTTQIATGRISKLQGVSNSEFLIAGSCKTVIHIVIQKSGIIDIFGW